MSSKMILISVSSDWYDYEPIHKNPYFQITVHFGQFMQYL